MFSLIIDAFDVKIKFWEGSYKWMSQARSF